MKPPLTEQQRTSLIRAYFPQVECRSVFSVPDSWDFSVSIVDGEYVFRFPKTEDARKTLRKEHRLLNYLKDKVGVQVPDYIFVKDDYEFVGYPLIKGTKLTEKVFGELAPEVKDRVCTELATFIAVLQGVPQSDLELLGYVSSAKSRASRAPREYFSKLALEIREGYVGTLTEHELSAIDAYIDRLLAFNSPKRVLRHSDLYSENIIVNQARTGLAGIIDFSDADVGHPAVEFSSFDDHLLEPVLAKTPFLGDAKFLKLVKFFQKRFLVFHLHGAISGKPTDAKQALDNFRARFSA